MASTLTDKSTATDPALSDVVTILADTTAPTVVFTDDLPGTANAYTQAINYTLTFSEPVTGLEAADFVVTNGMVSSVGGSGSVWSVSVLPRLYVSSGSVGVTLKAAAVSDAAGNPNIAANDSRQALDTLPPRPPITLTNAGFMSVSDPLVTFSTTMGDFVVALQPDYAPVTAANMLAYASFDWYADTLFHRVIPDFMAQGGGYTTGLVYRNPIYAPIVLESNNGLSNMRGTIAMARSSTPDTATTQFFVNVVDNVPGSRLNLDYTSSASPGYAVFGQIVAGMDVVDAIVATPTVAVNAGFQNAPVTEVAILSSTITTPGSAISTTGRFDVLALESTATWGYSYDAGSNWHDGTGNSFTVPAGSYAAGAIRVYQLDAAGNYSIVPGLYSSALVVGGAATLGVFALNAIQTEGAANAGATLSFEVARIGDLSQPCSVNWSVDSQLANPLDFGGLTLPSGSVSFAAGENSRIITLNVAGDAAFEPLETFSVKLSGAVGARIATASAQGAILNDDAATLNRTGTNAGETLTGGVGADWLRGLPGNDTLIGLGGDDYIDGGLGVDVARYNATLASAVIDARTTASPYDATVTVAGLGADVLTGVERLSFNDLWYALDVYPSGDVNDPVTKGSGGNAGKAYRLYQAALNREPDLEGLGYWIWAVDAGNSLYDIATGFIEGDEFKRNYGVDTTDEAFLTVIYQNVLGRDYDQAGFDWWLDVLSTHQTSRQQVLVDFSESPENKALLAGVIGDGFEYLPWFA